MKILHFRYEMRLSFDGPVTDHHFRFHCLPMETERQRVLSLKYGIEPAGTVRERVDGLGNRVCFGEALKPHDRLDVWAEGTVRTETPGVTDAGIPVEKKVSGGADAEAAERTGEHGGADAGDPAKKEAPGGTDAAPAVQEAVPVEFLLYRVPSELTRPGEKLKEFYGSCRKKFPGSGEPEFLMHELYRNFSYEKGRTGVATGAEEAFGGGRGVCQDYAQILVSLCRLAGYPARYVAGLLPGEGATHAWAEVWQNGGWTGLDPTHDRGIDERYIKLSHGRDFTDCSVERGCFKGNAGQRQVLSMSITVEEESV